MSNLETIIDFGSKNLRLEIYNEKSKNVFSSTETIINNLEGVSIENSLIKLIRNAEKYLSTHIENVIVLYDSAEYYSVDVSIKKVFDQQTKLELVYENLIEEAHFIVSQNYFKDQVIHLKINSITINEKKKLEEINKELKIKSLILEIKFLCLSKKITKKIYDLFKINNLSISNLYCSTYVKTFYYNQKFKNKNSLIFLDIGFNKTSCIILNNNKFKYFNTIAIGGNTITKDISKILNLDYKYSEELKINFNKNEDQLYLNKSILNNMNPFKKILNRKNSVQLLKQVIEERVKEIINLSIYSNNPYINTNTIHKFHVIFIGSGSKILSNSFNFNVQKVLSKLIFFDEKDSLICEAGLNYFKSNESSHTQTKKKYKKLGIFESFFNLFSK